LQLVSENKISAKNAFDIPLLEHLDDVIARPEQHLSKDEINFHRAAGTLDASARIYACRVDAVHVDAFKVRGGLSRATDVPVVDPEEGEAKRKHMGRCTLDSERNVTITDFDSCEQVDPFFQHMARLRESGDGESSLLLNLLPSASRGSLIFDGSTKFNGPQTKIDRLDHSDDALWQLPHLQGRLSCAEGTGRHVGLDSFSTEPPVDLDFFAAPAKALEYPAPELAALADVDIPDVEEMAEALPVDPELEPPADAEVVHESPADLPAVDEMLAEVNVGADAGFLFFDKDLWVPLVARRRKERQAKELGNEIPKEKPKKEKFMLDLRKPAAESAFGVEPAEKHMRKPPSMPKSEWSFIWQPSSDAFFQQQLLDSVLGKAASSELPADDFCDFGDFGEEFGQEFGQEFGEEFGQEFEDDSRAEMDEPVDDTRPGFSVSDQGIAFARTAAYVDVKVVKEAMTKSLEQGGVLGKKRAADTEQSPAGKRARVEPERIGFQQLIANARGKLPEQNRGGLSVAIGFICALHLCNDMNLELASTTSDEVFDTSILNARMGDFHVVAER
jgi:hypothetical protein